MKTLRRLLVTVLCLCLVLSCSAVTAFAADPTDPTGSITIQNPQNSDATVAGKTFNIYKIFEATTSGSYTSYSWHEHEDENGNKTIPFYDFFYGANGKLGENENGSVQNAVAYVVAEGEEGSLALSQLAEDLHAYVVANGIEAHLDPVTAGNTAESVNISGLSYGYYLIYDNTDLSGADTSAVRSAVMLTSVNKDVTITLKANRPQVLKQVLENDGETWGKGTSSNIGDTVTFKITTPIPDHTLYENYYFAIEDTMPEGMTLDWNSIVVKNGTETLTKGTVTDGDYVLISPTSEDTFDFKIDLTNFMETATVDNGNIVVTYNAVVNNAIEAQKANVNTATIVYSNDPTDETSRGNSSDSANVYSYQFVFTKFAQDTNGLLKNVRLAGAEFQLYRVEPDTGDTLIEFTEQVMNSGSDNEYIKYVVADAATDPDSKTSTLVVHEKGEATITLEGLNYGGHLGDVIIFGLSEGEYKLVETKAPDGYVLPEEPFILNIVDEIGELGSVGTLTVYGSHTGSGGIANTNGMAESILTVWAEITNKPGSALPETGGMGTALFTLVGIIMMAGAAAFFTLRKRNSQA